MKERLRRMFWYAAVALAPLTAIVPPAALAFVNAPMWRVLLCMVCTSMLCILQIHKGLSKLYDKDVPNER